MSVGGDAAEALLCIDRLQVGPATIESDRVAAVYTITRGRKSAEIELAFKYGEPILDASDPVLTNLAAMMVAQPALNYGLFCKEIVFRGALDRADRRFLQEMARHTAREVWVNKLLFDNPFIDPRLRAKIGAHPTDFLLSKLSFPDRPKSKRRPADTDGGARRRVAVLSSGGKDSLLSYGMLRESGAEVHPIFVNESGRHWYSALNAHRHFRDNVAHTARVWTNIDRLYNQMLRHLPFVRQDFARVRADQYPIRLWTVAGLIFAALPLLHHRKIGRLALGDEYDTTLRTSYRGIPHCAGLYDQSRMFDNAMSRYYASKRWGCAQFSILRSLSELLIEKILVERYPDLQRHQVSCHAAHIVDDRVLPCGKCEKCRRIVGMLSSLGADPASCGYTQEQIRSVLASLTPASMHQEAAGAEHMFHLLAERGLVHPSGTGLARMRPHPEVLKLRFDAEHSPFDVFPNDLRAPIYSIVREHAAGGVRRIGRVWTDVDPLGEESLGAPYRFE
jgi:7-cyano-7-deazaguanine synthase in queuosine biosynthesis